MAQEILNNVINSKISPEEVIRWLTSDTHQDLNWVDVKQSSTRAEFVVCFLNFLRDQFASIQQAANNVKQIQSEKKASQTPSTASVIITEPHKIDNSGSSLHDFSRLNDSRALEEKNTSSVQKHTLSDENVNRSRKIILEIPSHTDISLDGQENTNKVSESSNSCGKLLESENEVLEVQHNKSIENINDAVFASLNTRTSTPVIKKRISLQSVPVTSANLGENNINFSKSSDGKLNYCELHQKRESSVSINVQASDSIKSFGVISPKSQVDDFISSDSIKTFSPTNNLFASIAKNECSDSYSQVSGNSVRSELQFSNSSLLLNNIQNPISPLYSHSMMVTPKNAQKLQNKSSDRQLRINSSFQHSTPEQITNSSKNSVKSSSRRNLSLGDFITIDTRSSKKSSGKKSNQKMQLLRHSREDETVSMSTPFLAEENFPEVGQSFERRRRIKPTKLNVSDNKGNKENTVFGIVNRPITTNPQFSEAQSTDLTSDKTSFEVERVLLRLERQKKPQNLVDNKDKEPDIPFKIARPTKMLVLSESIVVPSLAMVDKTELLNTLVQLYIALIYNNLILNPMTEIYFILSLITTQYLHQNSQCTSTSKDHNIDTSSSVKFGEFQQGDSEINLGCTAFIDEANKEGDLLAEGNLLLSDKTDEELKKSALDNESETLTKILPEKNSISEVKNTFKIDDLHLGTPHNCVYFSTRVLNEVKHFLRLLDRTTLKLLSENVYITAFEPDLQDYLIKLYNSKLNEVNRIKQCNFSDADANVCFQIDTDNRENFPSAIAFQCFRKQRDMFYEILKIWEENHTKSNWKYSAQLSGKIKLMLTLHSDLTNHSHIARLFKSQLLISCMRSGQQEDFIDDESLSILKSIKGINPEKLTQLKERLVTPSSSQGPVPEPSFPGVQEFYKNFILYAFNPMFYAHLEDCLIHEIMEFNQTQFAGSDIEDSETMVDERTKQNFMTCLSKLRLLAKFMGFLVSLPYRSVTSTLEEVVNAQVSLRTYNVPSLDLQACIKEAVINGKLSLTIPWIVEYLSQMDIATLRLPYYTRLLEMLYCIYRISDSDNFVNSNQFMSQKTSVLIKFLLGWLFELSIFPTNLYFSCQSSYNSKKWKTICQVENEKMQVIVTSDKRNLSLDKLDIVDEKVLYSCCPFLVEIKVLLTTGNSQTIKSKSNRHITPVTSQLSNTADSTNAKNLEFQLEEAFFHGQPASTRKTVEFVSERVASTCVKYICNSLLPSAIEKSLNELRKVIEEKHSDNLEYDLSNLKTLMLKDMNTSAARYSRQVKVQCEKLIPSMCKERATQSIESLLAEDTSPSVKETCVRIAIRMATDCIAQWIQSHIVDGSLFMREVEFEINRIGKIDSSVTNPNNDNHNPDAVCATDILDDLRTCTWDFLDHKGKFVTLEIISKILDQLYSCFKERVDLTNGPENCLRSMSVDLSLFLVTHRTDLFTVEIQKKFVKFWKFSFEDISESESSLSRLLSPRNIMILKNSNCNDVWIKCGQFIKLLLKENVLSLESLSDQCVALFRQDWPTEILQNLSKCLNIGIEDYKVADEQAERMRCLLRWIAETYEYIDNLDE